MKYRHGTPPRINWKRWLYLSGLVLVVGVIAGWLAIDSWYQANLAPLTDESREQIVVIDLGSSTVEVANHLKGQSLIRDPRAFTWYVSRLPGEPQIQAGTYRLDSAMSVPDIVERLINGEVDTTLVTIPPGLRLDEIRQILINAEFKPEEVDAALRQDYEHPLLRFKPAGSSLEGYIYPETYQITANSTPASIILRSFELFYERLDSSLVEALERQGLGVHQAVILASIVQEESRDFEDQRKVAQVFLKRLEVDMPLGADATFRYAAAISGQEPSPTLDSPYNTRREAGLPPGPIANFSLDTLRAVANPADTDYLYFVHGDDCLERGGSCTTYFAHTEAEHLANVEKYCRENCQL